jgi:hypothetical protein
MYVIVPGAGDSRQEDQYYSGLRAEGRGPIFFRLRIPL